MKKIKQLQNDFTTPEQRKRRYERECELEQRRDYDDGGFFQ